MFIFHACRWTLETHTTNLTLCAVNNTPVLFRTSTAASSPIPGMETGRTVTTFLWDYATFSAGPPPPAVLARPASCVAPPPRCPAPAAGGAAAIQTINMVVAQPPCVARSPPPLSVNGGTVW